MEPRSSEPGGLRTTSDVVSLAAEDRRALAELGLPVGADGTIEASRVLRLWRERVLPTIEESDKLERDLRAEVRRLKGWNERFDEVDRRFDAFATEVQRKLEEESDRQSELWADELGRRFDALANRLLSGALIPTPTPVAPTPMVDGLDSAVRGLSERLQRAESLAERTQETERLVADRLAVLGHEAERVTRLYEKTYEVGQGLTGKMAILARESERATGLFERTQQSQELVVSEVSTLVGEVHKATQLFDLWRDADVLTSKKVALIGEEVERAARLATEAREAEQNTSENVVVLAREAERTTRLYDEIQASARVVAEGIVVLRREAERTSRLYAQTQEALAEVVELGSSIGQVATGLRPLPEQARDALVRLMDVESAVHQIVGVLRGPLDGRASSDAAAALAALVSQVEKAEESGGTVPTPAGETAQAVDDAPQPASEAQPRSDWITEVHFSGAPLAPLVRLRAKRALVSALGHGSVTDAPDSVDLWVRSDGADLSGVREALEQTLAGSGVQVAFREPATDDEPEPAPLAEPK